MSQDQFEKADRAIVRAADAIESAVTNLLAATRPLEQVARDSVIERLVDRLMARNPQAMDYLTMKSGTATVALANALMDWRDEWVAR